MPEPVPRTATILPFRKKIAPRKARAGMATTIEVYSALYPTPCRMVLLVESWLFAAQRDGMARRNPEYVAALRRAITALRFSDSVAEAVARLRRHEAGSGH
jgi:hypothetical protein